MFFISAKQVTEYDMIRHTLGILLFDFHVFNSIRNFVAVCFENVKLATKTK